MLLHFRFAFSAAAFEIEMNCGSQWLMVSLDLTGITIQHRGFNITCVAIEKYSSCLHAVYYRSTLFHISSILTKLSRQIVHSDTGDNNRAVVCEFEPAVFVHQEAIRKFEKSIPKQYAHVIRKNVRSIFPYFNKNRSVSQESLQNLKHSTSNNVVP